MGIINKLATYIWIESIDVLFNLVRTRNKSISLRRGSVYVTTRYGVNARVAGIAQEQMQNIESGKVQIFWVF